MKYIILTLLLISSLCYAQYDANISGYNIYVYKLSIGQTMPVGAEVINGDTTLNLAWKRGIDNPPEVPLPYINTFVTMMWVGNTPQLWTPEGALSSQSISLTDGHYAFRVDEVGVNNDKSSKSAPLYLEAIVHYAKMPMNVRF